MCFVSWCNGELSEVGYHLIQFYKLMLTKKNRKIGSIFDPVNWKLDSPYYHNQRVKKEFPYIMLMCICTILSQKWARGVKGADTDLNVKVIHPNYYKQYAICYIQVRFSVNINWHQRNSLQSEPRSMCMFWHFSCLN